MGRWSDDENLKQTIQTLHDCVYQEGFEKGYEKAVRELVTRTEYQISQIPIKSERYKPFIYELHTVADEMIQGNHGSRQ